LDTGPLSEFDELHFEYFRDFRAAEFSLYFELESWQAIIMQGVYTEACMWHAALAIGALGRSRYLPNTTISIEPNEYGLRQYTLAIQKLNQRLDSSTRGWELALLGSIVFIAIEMLLGQNNRVQIHLQGAFEILKTPTNALEYPMSLTHPGQDSLVAYSTCHTSLRLNPNSNYLVKALAQIDEQLTAFQIAALTTYISQCKTSPQSKNLRRIEQI
jgi:hypothetical protein